MNKMTFKEALESMGSKDTLTASGARLSLDEGTEKGFANEIYQQVKDGNKQTLIDAYGEDVIRTIVAWSSKRAAEIEFMIMHHSEEEIQKFMDSIL